MTYYLAPSLAALRTEVDTRWPRRDKASDGWVGDTSHNARPSDHNPDWDSGGVVRALDIDVRPDRDPDTSLARQVIRACVGDPRVWYVIFNRRIYSVTYGWEARAYTGSNPHTAHIHVSIRHTDRAERDTSPWFDDRRRPQRTRPVVDLSALRAAWRSGEQSRHVARVQRALNDKARAGLTVDGMVGRATREAWVAWERKVGVREPNQFPHYNSLAELGKGRWMVRR